MVFKEQEGMNAREKILSKLKTNQPKRDLLSLTELTSLPISNPVEKFKEVLITIGGSAIEIQKEHEINERLTSILPPKQNINLVGLDHAASTIPPQSFADTDIAILRAEFAVAENGSVWVTDRAMIDRALPFICANLVIVVSRSSIVNTMHDAYERIGNLNYEFGTFIAGPSKTADIEQSLVLGAHGAKTMICFIVNEPATRS